MQRSDFYDVLNSLPRCYQWTREGKSINARKTSGVDSGTTFNPITAVAHKLGKGTFGNNKKDTLKAGTAIGLPRTFTSNIYDASRSTYNRGNTQVVRGRLLSVLEV